MIWLTVLLVGLFGGNILKSTPGGSSTSVPVVIVLVVFALPATIAIARRGFSEGADHDEPAVPAENPREVKRTAA